MTKVKSRRYSRLAVMQQIFKIFKRALIEFNQINEASVCPHSTHLWLWVIAEYMAVLRFSDFKHGDERCRDRIRFYQCLSSVVEVVEIGGRFFVIFHDPSVSSVSGRCNLKIQKNQSSFLASFFFFVSTFLPLI